MGDPRTRGEITLVAPRSPLRYNTHRSAPPVSALALSRGPRKRSQSPVDMLEHRDTYGQAQVCSKGHQGSSVDHPCLPLFIGSSSGKYGIRYLRVFDYVSVSQCATGTARESEVYPNRPQIENTYLSYTTTAWRLSTFKCNNTATLKAPISWNVFEFFCVMTRAY